MTSEVPPVEGSQPSTWARRMWRSLSVANVWASGVATREHAWGMVVAAVFFAVTSWYLSDVRLSVALGGSQAKGSE